MQYNLYLSKKGKTWTQRHTHRKIPCEDGCRDWGDDWQQTTRREAQTDFNTAPL